MKRPQKLKFDEFAAANRAKLIAAHVVRD